MSYEISYRRQAFILPAAYSGHYDDTAFLIEEAGSSNCYEMDSNRRSRAWGCLAAGPVYSCLAAVTRTASDCCSGCLVLNGRRGTTPEAYIKAWRKAIAEAAPLTRENLRGFNLELFIAISDREAENDRKYAFETLSKQSLVQARRKRDAYRDIELTEWRFDLWKPEEFQLWLENRPSNPGWKSVRATGP